MRWIDDEDNESDDLLDAEMEEPVIGNELMLMEDDDLLGEELGRMKSVDKEDHAEPGMQRERREQDGTILMIEASKELGTEAADEESVQKTITRSITRSLFPTQQGNQCRASPHINAQPTTQVENIARGKRGASSRKATTSVGKQSMVNVKHPPHIHQ